MLYDYDPGNILSVFKPPSPRYETSWLIGSILTDGKLVLLPLANVTG